MIRVDDNLGDAKMSPEVYRAVIDEAHKRGLASPHIFSTSLTPSCY